MRLTRNLRRTTKLLNSQVVRSMRNPRQQRSKGVPGQIRDPRLRHRAELVPKIPPERGPPERRDHRSRDADNYRHLRGSAHGGI